MKLRKMVLHTLFFVMTFLFAGSMLFGAKDYGQAMYVFYFTFKKEDQLVVRSVPSATITFKSDSLEGTISGASSDPVPFGTVGYIPGSSGAKKVTIQPANGKLVSSDKKRTIEYDLTYDVVKDENLHGVVKGESITLTKTYTGPQNAKDPDPWCSLLLKLNEKDFLTALPDTYSDTIQVTLEAG